MFFLAACEDMFSLTPMEQLASFQATADLGEADRILAITAQRHRVTVNRDPQPRESPVPRDYLATVVDRKCLLLIEGSGRTSAATVKVTLEAAEGSRCDQQMWSLFNDLRTSFQRKG